MPPAIRVHNLGKRYRISHEGNAHGKYRTLRDSVMDIVKAPLRRLKNRGEQGRQEDFWALKDVSFDVQPGEVVGIIGRNGAGKSTLLKILSRITKPSTGSVELNGRVGSLLEVGTGFHPELTGRENIFLNGSILGMKRAEIQKQFDAIVDFSGVEKFLDTPVKRYSSGMAVRLAFAVAAHLSPETLVVDEVLAVGDMAFQQKCMGKMSEVASAGRTVLFVSHNMGAISKLCTRSIVVVAGQVDFDGDSISGVSHYFASTIGDQQSKLRESVIFDNTEPPTSAFEIQRIETFDEFGMPKAVVRTWDRTTIRITFAAARPLARASAVLEIATMDGSRVLLLSTEPDSTMPLDFRGGEQAVECVIDKLPLAAGRYVIGAGLAIPNNEWLWHRPELGYLTVEPQDVYGSGLAPQISRCLIAINHKWREV